MQQIVSYGHLARCVTELCIAARSADAAAASAYWGGAAVWTALAGVVVSCLTLIAAVVAAKFAKDAVAENRRSADAAMQATRLSEQALRHTLSTDRPWVVIEEVISGRRHDPRDAGSFFGTAITIRISNCGTRPAVNGAVEWEYFIIDKDSIVPNSTLFADRLPEGSFTIGPGKTHNSEVLKLDVNQSECVLNSKKDLIVCYRISYEGQPGTQYLNQGMFKMRPIMPAEVARTVSNKSLFAPDLFGRSLVS